MMTPVLLLLLALLPVEAAQIDYPRTMYVGYARAPLYESADYLSSIVGELRRGDSVRVLGAEGKFFRIEHGGADAYLLGSNLTLAVGKKPSKNGASASPPARRATPPKKQDSAAAAATQCSATTRTGSRCSRMVEDGTGICWQHRRK